MDTFVKGAVVGGATAVLAQAAVTWWRARRAAADAEMSTTSSSHSGNVYETNKAVAEYLMFHFGAPEDVLPYANGPKAALDFPAR